MKRVANLWPCWQPSRPPPPERPRAVRAAEVGVTDKEVIVGAGLDLTGAVANWGVNIKAGMEAVFNRVNEAGGVHGRKIRLIAYDHVYQPPKAVTNAKRLVERDKVFVMMGHLGTPTTKAIKDYLEEKQVPNIFPATLASIWATSGKWHVGDLATYADQTWMIIDYLVKDRKIRKIASFYQDDEYGLDGHLAGKARLKQLRSRLRGRGRLQARRHRLQLAGGEAQGVRGRGRHPAGGLSRAAAAGRAVPRHRVQSPVHRPLADRAWRRRSSWAASTSRA